MHSIQWTVNHMPATDDRWLAALSPAEAERARAFHRSFPMYAPTPLVRLDALARRLRLGAVYVKDESRRFGLNAFKVLGGSYAIARHIAAALGRDISQMSHAALLSDAVREALGQTTFFTATDGNHGRGVAWAARELGQKAVIFMPRGTKPVRMQNIRALGAKVTIEDVNYDACVRMAGEHASRTPGGVLVQDTAWPGYEQMPLWVMQGYGTMAAEAAEQMGRRPTHIFLQAGVGSMPGAVQGYFAGLYPENPPRVTVVEASAAACLYESARAGDGRPRSVGGDLATMMAGLACGVPNPIAFDVLKNHAFAFAACPDWVGAMGMRVLGAPLEEDGRVISGESGAAGLGLLYALMTGRAEGLREALGLDETSVVLLFSTEGDTDPDNYRRVVWDGAEGL